MYETASRFYAPNPGRWHSPDPLAGDITNPQSLNRYAYVLNNPTGNTDPSGLSCVTEDDGLTGDDGDCADAGISSADDYPTGLTMHEEVWAQADRASPTLLGEWDLVPGSGQGQNLGGWDIGLVSGLATLPLGGIGTGAGIPTVANNGPASPGQRQCLTKVQGAVNAGLGTQSVYEGVTQGMDANGMRGGAYNFDFFAPNINIVSLVQGNCGRFSGGLHTPIPGSFWCNPSKDPTISNWGYDPSLGGSFLTAHIDSSNPFQDLYSLLVHLINDLILQKKHGC
jgi:uncharacterized protein RhaS with RHS repeats